MRLKRINKSLIFGGFTLFFVFYLSVNYVNLSKSSLQKSSIQLQENSDTLASHPDLIVRQTSKIEHRIRDYGASDKASNVVVENKSDVGSKRPSRYYVYDGAGFGSFNSGVNECPNSPNVEIKHINSLNKSTLFYFNTNIAPKSRERFVTNNGQYLMVYGLESEVHSTGGSSWDIADFRMFYNLDKSFPEPATYFDTRQHLIDLLSPPRVQFSGKTRQGYANIAWVVSNCAAYNGRQIFMKQLMNKMSVDSYGGCLKNKFTHPSEHMRGNIDLFSNYKFTIAIENSNCEDYVTEKLVHAIASGSIPIVAGRDNKPNYLKFLPKGSYINIYDYKTIDELVKHLTLIASSQVEYEKFMPFKFGHKYTRDVLNKYSLADLIVLAKTIISPNETFFGELIAKEKSENKLCKIARWLETHKDKDERSRLIEQNRAKRPDTKTACLSRQNLKIDFGIFDN